MTVETDTPKVATAVTTVQVRQGEEGAFAGWLAELNKTVATFPGYISAVVIPPAPPAQQDWVMVQRFQTLKQLGAWLDSDERRSLLDKSASLLVDEGTTNVIEGASTEPSPQDMVTEIITVSVKPRCFAPNAFAMRRRRFCASTMCPASLSVIERLPSTDLWSTFRLTDGESTNGHAARAALKGCPDVIGQLLGQ
jgi:heme-degrading monooxygenase HmoA